MGEVREKVALTALLMAILAVLLWIGFEVSTRQRSSTPTRFADALWTMTHTLEEDGR